jgi:urea transport system permease protein
MRQIGGRGVYGNPVLPDFMVFLNWKELPWFWYGFDWFIFAMAMVLLVPGLLAFVFGWLAFRSRVNGVYLSIITQAMTYALMLAFFRNDMGFGGNNGLTDFKDILGFQVQADGTRAVLFAMSALMLALCLIIASAITRSKFGKVLVGVRDAESRVRFLGFRVENIKLFTFVVSAMFAGIAGALFVPQVGIINPGEFAPANSIEVVVWTAVGGRGTLIGPILGAVLVNAGKSFFTGAFPEFWLYALGGLFIAVTLFLPRGIVGTIQHGWNARKAMKAAAEAEKGKDADIPMAQQVQAAE